MPSMKDLRKKVLGLRDSVKSRKAGLAAHRTEEEAGWYDYAMSTSDKTREELNEILEMVDQIIGARVK